MIKIDKNAKKYVAHEVILIEPTNFASNKETAKDNTYMHPNEVPENIHEIVLAEHRDLQKKITDLGGKLKLAHQVIKEAYDSIFACDWFLTLRDSAFPDGLLVLFPLRWHSRQLERNPELIADLSKRYKTVLDLTHWEKKGKSLESIGVVSLDYHNRILYMNESERAHAEVLHDFVEQLNKLKKDEKEYTSCILKAWDPVDNDVVFHTSMYLNFTDSTVFYGPDFITDVPMRKVLMDRFIESGYDIIELSVAECRDFCSNVTEFAGKDDRLCLAIAARAARGYTPENLAKLKEKYLLAINDNDNILKFGGGSTRCMSNLLF